MRTDSQIVHSFFSKKTFIRVDGISFVKGEHVIDFVIPKEASNDVTEGMVITHLCEHMYIKILQSYAQYRKESGRFTMVNSKHYRTLVKDSNYSLGTPPYIVVNDFIVDNTDSVYLDRISVSYELDVFGNKYRLKFDINSPYSAYS